MLIIIKKNKCQLVLPTINMTRVAFAMPLVKKPSNGIYYLFDDSFKRWNASGFWCQKGCDFARGRQSDPLLRYALTINAFN